ARGLKRFLVASAGVCVGGAGAQAADLHVKAKPVEYVKVCSLYGAGFWYVPGTDTCLKIGSFVRVQTTFNNSTSNIPIGGGNNDAGGRETRTDTSNFRFPVRRHMSVDLATQTECGTLRSYMDVGAQWSTPGTSAADNNGTAADTLYVSRGFIQFAGFTAGRIRSFFDVNSLLTYTYSVLRISGDTSHTDGIYGLAYTAQFGNGITASISFEDNGLTANGRGHLISNLSMPSFGLGSQSFDNKGPQAPDVVGNLRIDQAWGYAQVSAALHDASGGYYGVVNSTVNGHPSDKWGFAVTGGVTLDGILRFKGGQVGLPACYAQGAPRDCTPALGSWPMYDAGNKARVR